MTINLIVEDFQNDLLYWFERNLRDLPWRRDRDPYRIWVSEIMLQQTRVDTVIPFYERFMTKFPTITDLAEAGEEEVLKLWEGLGYYSRARNLHAGVREVQEKYKGRVPDSPEEIGTIKGIGPYTAGAVLSIAYGKPEPAVDGNVMRVISRITHIEEDVQKAGTRKQIERVVRELISKDNPSYFNQALMELGALICAPRSPKCEICPVSKHCRANQLGIQEQLPIKGKAKPPREVELAVFFLHHEGKFFIEQRPKKGLLAGLWQLPIEEGRGDQFIEPLIKKQGISMKNCTRLFDFQHTFSHLQWNMEIYSIAVDYIPEGMKGRWVDFADLAEFTFPVSFQKIIAKIQREMT